MYMRVRGESRVPSKQQLLAFGFRLCWATCNTLQHRLQGHGALGAVHMAPEVQVTGDGTRDCMSASRTTLLLTTLSRVFGHLSAGRPPHSGPKTWGPAAPSFRNTRTEYLREAGLKWMNGGAK